MGHPPSLFPKSKPSLPPAFEAVMAMPSSPAGLAKLLQISQRSDQKMQFFTMVLPMSTPSAQSPASLGQKEGWFKKYCAYLYRKG